MKRLCLSTGTLVLLCATAVLAQQEVIKNKGSYDLESGTEQEYTGTLRMNAIDPRAVPRKAFYRHSLEIEKGKAISIELQLGVDEKILDTYADKKVRLTASN